MANNIKSGLSQVLVFELRAAMTKDAQTFRGSSQIHPNNRKIFWWEGNTPFQSFHVWESWQAACENRASAGCDVTFLRHAVKSNRHTQIGFKWDFFFSGQLKKQIELASWHRMRNRSTFVWCNLFSSANWIDLIGYSLEVMWLMVSRPRVIYPKLIKVTQKKT